VFNPPHPGLCEPRNTVSYIRCPGGIVGPSKGPIPMTLFFEFVTQISRSPFNHPCLNALRSYSCSTLGPLTSSRIVVCQSHLETTNLLLCRRPKSWPRSELCSRSQISVRVSDHVIFSCCGGGHHDDPKLGHDSHEGQARTEWPPRDQSSVASTHLNVVNCVPHPIYVLKHSISPP
jgi:hypothetical protein